MLMGWPWFAIANNAMVLTDLHAMQTEMFDL